MYVNASRPISFLVTSAVVVIAELAGFGLSVCEAQQRGEPVAIPVASYNETGDKLPQDAIPRDLALTLGAIPGKFGGTGGKNFASLRIGREESVRLNLDELSVKVSSQAAELDASPSLQIRPQGARFARVATGVWFAAKRPVTLSVGFIDSETGHSLTLLYFDRPCRLSGTVFVATPGREPLTDDYDIDVESAGFVWMVS